MRYHEAAARIALIALLTGCIVGQETPDREKFESTIVPLIERDCGTNVCHAATGNQFDELPEEYFVFPVDDSGHITGAERLDKAYERTVAKLHSEDARFSDFIRKPLDVSLGGSEHRGGAQYRSMNDETLETLLAWSRKARPRELPEITDRAARYAAEFQPILAEKRCMLSSCHGASASNSLIFDPGFLGEFDINSSNRNYEKVVAHLNFASPDPMLSRLVRKTIPLDQGGIFHRGGNDFFDPSAEDEDLATITSFISDVRTELGADETGVVSGLVFVSTDPTPRNIFDISAFQPGGDVHSLIPATPDGTLTNLTAAHHTGPADIRDPAVSYDGTKVAFAMRQSMDDCLNLYVMDIDGSNLTQLTNDTGTLPNGLKISNVEPLWGPDDRLYFTSTRAGALAAHGGNPQSNMWRINADGSGLLRMTFNAGYELAPGWHFGAHHGEEEVEHRTLDLSFTGTRKVGAKLFGPIMRVPPDFHADYHPHYGTQNPNYQLFTQMTMMPDVRNLLLVMDEANVWEGGALGLIDRNLGPVIKDGGAPALVNYVDSLQLIGAIGDVVRHTGMSPDGYYRDPYAMPDGTLVVGHSEAAIDLTDPLATPDTGIYQLSLIELPGNHTVVESKELLVDIPGKIESDPRPIYVRWREEVGDPLDYLDNDRTTGTLLNFDLAVEFILGNEDSPSGEKRIDSLAESIHGVRLVEEIPPQPGESAGRAQRGMRRILAEFEATSDKSMYLELPAGVPFFIQTLDENGMATHTFNQWFFVLPGEELNQVTRREVYNNRCGGCHGSVSGSPGDTVGTPDVLTEASRVVANYDPVTREDIPPISRGVDITSRQEIDFDRDIQPLLSSTCATGGCHDGTQVPDLTARTGAEGFSGAYEALTASAADSSGNGFLYVDALSSSAHTSYLAEVLLGQELAAPRTMDSDGCPSGSMLSDEDKRTLLRWMDMGANYLGIGPTTAPSLPSY